MLHVSPSRSVWAAAKAGGVSGILPAEQAQLYARRDFNADGEEQAEVKMYDGLRSLRGQMDRTGFPYATPAAVDLTQQQRGDLLLALDELTMKMEELLIRLGIERGADEAVAAGATTLDAMYPYQRDSVAALHLNGGITGSFFGPSSTYDFKPLNPPKATHR